LKNESNWIVANEFIQNQSNELVKTATNYSLSHIDGLVFISDQDITSESKYSHPELISLLSAD
jgi:hypothetical protein